MTISINRLTALSIFKTKELFKNKTFILSLILVPGLTFGMRLVYENIVQGEMPSSMFAMVLNLGVLYNLNMISLMMPATMLAKDKEKHTLRTLMTSSVEGTEYFIGGILPSLFTSILINIAVLLISGLSLETINIPLYILVTTIAGFTSCVLGMIIGIFSKNQMSSSNLVTIAMLILMVIPMFSGMVEGIKSISGFLYTGIVSEMIEAFADGQNYQLSLKSWVVLLISVVASVGMFLFFYRKNGFEKD